MRANYSISNEQPSHSGGTIGSGGVIDAHQHFWKFDPVRDSWINQEMALIRRDFMPADLKPLLDEAGVDGCVVVQSDSSEEENAFQLANAEEHDFVKGVVGWVDLQSPALEERLIFYKGFPKMKGFRHVLQGESDRALMLRPEFMRGIGLLERYGFSYDILIYPDQLGYAGEFVRAFPEQRFVIDHIAKPHIKDRYITEEWISAIREVATGRNVFCKVSGMVTEADWRHWEPAHLRPYIDTVVEAFGMDRLMYGSDWPVCLVAGDYHRVIQVVRDYFAPFSKEEQAALFGGNAKFFYHL